MFLASRSTSLWYVMSTAIVVFLRYVFFLFFSDVKIDWQMNAQFAQIRFFFSHFSSMLQIENIFYFSIHTCVGIATAKLFREKNIMNSNDNVLWLKPPNAPLNHKNCVIIKLLYPLQINYSLKKTNCWIEFITIAIMILFFDDNSKNFMMRRERVK